ncbi:MAG: sugar porter family MFS transporter [Planctomycetota bacterium]
MPFVLRIVLVAALGGFLFGFDTAVINGAVPVLRTMYMDASTGFAGGLPITHEARGFWVGQSVAMALVGAAIGAFAAGPLMNRMGRKRSMVLAAALCTVSAIGSGLPATILDFTFWRFLGGLAFGAASVIAPAYIAEVSPARMRGTLGSLQQLAIVIGIFVAQVSNWAIAEAAGGAGKVWFGAEAWRWMFWVEAIPSVLYGLMALGIPESPRYLVMKGRDERASAVLARLTGSADAATAKVAEIRDTLDTARPPRLSDILGPGLFKRIVWIGIVLSVLQQFVGINVVFYFSATLWEAVGFSQDDALLLSILTSTTNVLTTLIAVALIDKIGRKPLLIAGSIGMTVALAVEAYALASGDVVNGELKLDKTQGLMAVIAANVFVFSFGFSWGPIVWVLLGEMFTNRIRAGGLAVGACAQWVANYIISATFLLMATGLGLGLTYGLYAGCALLSLFFVILFVPETKGRELESMGDFDQADAT